MTQVLEETLRELVDCFTQCTVHVTNEDAYPSPSFSEFLNRPLMVSDIPMQSSSGIDERPLRKDPTFVPWEDSIKNFIFDVTSVNTKQRFETCIILADKGYKYMNATSSILIQKYLNMGGSIIEVIPNPESEDIFDICVKNDDGIQYSWQIDRDLLVGNLLVWYREKQTLIYCHDTFIDEYLEIILSMPESTWSVSCTISNFIEPLNKATKCFYMCPVYSCEGSLETRAVSNGQLKLIKHKIPGSYEGRLNYYQKSVRGSRHSSGRCYECQVLYKTITSIYKSPLSTPATPRITKFSDTFLDSPLERK